MMKMKKGRKIELREQEEKEVIEKTPEGYKEKSNST